MKRLALPVLAQATKFMKSGRDNPRKSFIALLNAKLARLRRRIWQSARIVL
jgi:hypothetical protein